jgi:UDP-N-acetylglucosamine 2-epimerase (non-hydrolysing)
MTDPKKKRILLVFGTRPEAIKMSPVVKEFQKYPDRFKTIVCVTAQHREMLDQVLKIFEIVPDFDLNIMQAGQDLTDVTTRVLTGMRDVLKKTKPDLVLVHGDTTTSMAAALAAFYQKIKVGHVEAGLRTNNMQSPWPEEMNRQVTDRICNYYFAPTELSKQNLIDEKIDQEKIFVTGNTVIDALLMAVEMIKSKNGLENQIIKIIKEKGYSVNERNYILVTGHRRENFGEGFLNICKALKEIALQNPLLDIVYPVHLNPNVQKPVFDLLSDLPNIYLIAPLDYLPFVYTMQHSYIILTDSGGIQEEAPSLGKPVLVMRDTTERPEAVNAGTAMIVGTNYEKIVMNVSELLNNTSLYKKIAEAHNPYGDGKASQKIVNSLS